MKSEQKGEVKTESGKWSLFLGDKKIAEYSEEEMEVKQDKDNDGLIWLGKKDDECS